MNILAVSDVHGFKTELMMALEGKGLFEGKVDKLVICGDLLDRGEEAVETVDVCLELMRQDKLIYIAGNHEDMFVHALQSIARGEVMNIAGGMSPHYHNGTWDTLLQLSGMSAKEAASYPDELIRAVRASRFYKELLPAALDYYETENYIFCHGWIPAFAIGYPIFTSFEYDPAWRCATPDRWKRARWYNGMELSCRYRINEPSKTIVCGHWHASYGHSVYEKKGSEWGEDADFSPFRADGIIAIDACTAASGVVNCISLEDGELPRT